MRWISIFGDIFGSIFGGKVNYLHKSKIQYVHDYIDHCLYAGENDSYLILKGISNEFNISLKLANQIYDDYINQ